MATAVLSDWQVVQRSVCQRDGRWFCKLLQAETDRMEGWCRQMELDQRENALPEDSKFYYVNEVYLSVLYKFVILSISVFTILFYMKHF